MLVAQRTATRLLHLPIAYRPFSLAQKSLPGTVRTMSSPAPSPPPKRLKADVVEVDEVPVKALYVPVASSSKAPLESKRKEKKRKQRRPLPDPYSSQDVMFHDVRDYLGQEYVDELLARKDDSEWHSPAGLELQKILELRVGSFTVSGESLSLYEENGKKWAIITPFAHPGDLIRCRVYKHDRLASYADLLEILEYSEEYRGGEGDRRKHPEGGCKYFGECGGCQLQPVPYPLQLLHKRRTVDLAYQRFSGLDSTLVPTIRDTIGSPKQWGYRTKITPHFDAPPKILQRARANGHGGNAEEEAMNAAGGVNGHTKSWECRIGFERKGRPGVMDIEECPIATSVINDKLVIERKRIKESIWSFKRGATLLLRDALPAPELLPTAESPFNPASAEPPHVAITNHREAVYERVGDFLFSFAAGSFFQNNNSILVPLTQYVKEAIFPPESTASKPTHLVDTYCGSGLFGITLSPRFERVAGVEISHDSIVAAKKNAEMNGLHETTTWLCGKAEDIFAGLPEHGFRGDNSCVVVDPPRKGCDEPFLRQLLTFQPLTIVYVSCNVHTQARDVGFFLHEAEKLGKKYILESVRGFDLFPQTAHVESVAVLRQAA